MTNKTAKAIEKVENSDAYIILKKRNLNKKLEIHCSGCGQNFSTNILLSDPLCPKCSVKMDEARRKLHGMRFNS